MDKRETTDPIAAQKNQTAPMRRRRKNRWRRGLSSLLASLSIAFAFFFVFSGLMAVRSYRQGRSEQAAFEALAASVRSAGERAVAYAVPEEGGAAVPLPQQPGEPADTAGAPGVKEVAYYTPYYSLYELNEDFAGWLTVENTEIDYPVMCSPSNPEFYLNRAFDRTDSVSGTPFIGAGGNADSDCCIIYAHSMKNGTMFGTLDRYAKRSFWEETPTFTLTTVTQERVYEVFAAVMARVLYSDETGYRYYTQVGELSEERYGELVRWLSANSLYDTGIVPVYGEQIVILSTCHFHTDNGRFIVAARRVDA